MSTLKNQYRAEMWINQRSCGKLPIVLANKTDQTDEKLQDYADLEQRGQVRCKDVTHRPIEREMVTALLAWFQPAQTVESLSEVAYNGHSCHSFRFKRCPQYSKEF